MKQTDLLEECTSIFNTGIHEDIQQGYKSNFEKHLVNFLEHHNRDEDGHSDEAYLALAITLQSYDGSDYLVECAIEVIGRIENEENKKVRLMLLTSLLSHKRSGIRDAALSALAYIDDPIVLPAIKKMIESEDKKWVTKWASQVLKQLEDTRVEGE